MVVVNVSGCVEGGGRALSRYCAYHTASNNTYRVRKELVLRVAGVLHALLDQRAHLLDAAIEFGLLRRERAHLGIEGVEFRLGVARRTGLVAPAG